MTWIYIDWSNPLNAWFIVLVDVFGDLKCDNVSKLLFSIRLGAITREAFGDFIGGDANVI